MQKNEVPKFHELMNPLLRALHDLGGSGSIDEIYEKVLENEGFPDHLLDIPHNPEKSNQTEIGYRLAWARTYLKKYGVLDNSSRGVWVVVPEKRDVTKVDPKKVVPEEARSWRAKLHQVLTQEMTPEAFERLTKRILRESGFVQVEVTGRSGDGGVDGKGIIRIGGLLSFHVVFQCKRYQGAVSSSHIRDFRGAMVGRADKGLMITTGTFTRDAIKEATRDGAPPIDLVDGDQLADKLKELELGIRTEVVEKVVVDDNWFRQV
jgi:restriction system protein